MFDEALLRSLIGIRSLPLDALFGAVWLATVYNALWFAFALVSLRRGRRGWWLALAVLLAIALEYVVVDLLLKPAVARPRPYLALADITPHLVPFLPSSFSFPSGDAAGSFAAATALGWQRRRWLGWLAGIAALVCLERVYLGLHWPSDVLAGAVIGIACGAVALQLTALARAHLPWRAIVIPHTHWDREWYETVAGYRPRLLAAADGIVAELERDGGVDRFTFDGQTIALEDYLGDRPAMRDRVDALVRAGKLLIGPWYVLSDLILVHGESTIRNLQEGLRVAQQHGRAMRAGYVADPFGHPAQMPQIVRGFGYRSYVFARGLGDEGEDLGAEFEWEAPSGDRVLALHQVGHYDNALDIVRDRLRTEEVERDLPRRVRRYLPRVVAHATPYAHTDVLLLMVGTDHTPIMPELAEAVGLVKELRPRLSARVGTLEEALDALSPLPALPVHAGEMISGRYRPILRGVNSTRIWIKQENAALERLLLGWLEPFGALLGGADRETLRELWRTLLQCHPHDSICGCSIDEVHDVDMRARFASVRERAESLRRMLLEPAGDAVAWTPHAFEHAAVVDHDGSRRLVRFAGLGGASLEGGTPSAPVRASEDGVLDNGGLRVEVGQDGSFFVHGPGGRTGPHNLFLDEGDRGDEYTYSFAGPSISSAGAPGQRTVSCDGLRGEVRVRLTLRVPASIRADRRARAERLVDLPIETRVTLDAEADRVEVATTVENAARDHRLRVLFSTGRASRGHVAAEQFAWLRRSNRPQARAGWAEQPPDTAHAQDFVALADPVGGVAVAGDGLPEYGILADGRQIGLTLLRAVGFLSRADLPERPGHAGPQLETPSAQMLGSFVGRYCLVPLGSDGELARAARSVRCFLEPPFVGRGAPRTLLKLEGDGAIELSALRAGASSGTLVLRLVNPSATEASARILFAPPLAFERATDLREGEEDLGSTGLPVIRTAAPLETDGDGLRARLAPFEIGTWTLRSAQG